MYKYSEDSTHCLNCGSKYFAKSARGVQCKLCGHGSLKEEEPAKKGLEVQSLIVIAGPATIGSQHGHMGMEIESGKFAVCRLDRLKDGNLALIAQFSTVFDNKGDAERIANHTKMPKIDEETVLQSTAESTNYMHGIELEEEEEVIELTEEMEVKEPVEVLQTQKESKSLAVFFCDECDSHLTVNIKKFPEQDRHIMSCPRMKKTLDNREEMCSNIMTREDS